MRLPLAATAACLFATQVIASPATCTDISGHNMPSIGSNLTANLNSGEEVTVTAGSGSSAYVFELNGTSTFERCGFIYGGASCAGHVFSAGSTGSYTIEKTGGVAADTLSCAVGSKTTVPSVPLTTKPTGLHLAKQTFAPDLIPSNVGTCDGRFVSGFQILGGGKISWYVEAKHADECFDKEVTFLPAGVRSRDWDAIFAFLGTSDFDLYSRN